MQTKELAKRREIMKKLNFFPSDNSNSVLFFPIKREDIGLDQEQGMVLLEKVETGSSSLVKAGYILQRPNDIEKVKKNGEVLTKTEKKNVVRLAYVTTEYAKEFNMKEYLAIMGQKISNEDLEILTKNKVYLVNKNSVLMYFDSI